MKRSAVKVSERLRSWLLSPRRTPLTHGVVAGAITAELSTAVVYLLVAVLKAAGVNMDALPSRDLELGMPLAVAGVFVAPVVETLVLAAVIALLGRTSSSPLFVAACAGALAGLAHGPNPVAMAGTASAFFVFSCCFMAWRARGLGAGLLAAGVPHAVSNAIVLLLAFNGY